MGGLEEDAHGAPYRHHQEGHQQEAVNDAGHVLPVVDDRVKVVILKSVLPNELQGVRSSSELLTEHIEGRQRIVVEISCMIKIQTSVEHFPLCVRSFQQGLVAWRFSWFHHGVLQRARLPARGVPRSCHEEDLWEVVQEDDADPPGHVVGARTSVVLV